MTGSADLTGSLSLQAPASLSWAETLNGLDQQVVDLTDTTYTATDSTASGAGWYVSITATQFTGTTSDADLLPDTAGSSETNGSTSSESATTAPGETCAVTAECTLATNGLTYPVLMAADGTAYTVYDAAATTGEGAIVITPAAWWLNIPANTVPDTYTSAITLAISTGPPPA
jgi:hypothetical protein